MAKAKVICTCATCGKTFVKTKDCCNRAEADSFEAWARDNCTECYDCYKAKTAADAANKASELVATYKLPAVTGVSDKQIAYATNLRERYLMTADKELAKATKLLAQINDNPARTAEAARAKGKSVEECTIDAMQTYGLLTAYICITESDAHTLIDKLKN